MLVTLFVLHAISSPHATRVRKLFSTVLAEEIPFGGAGKRMFMVLRVGAVAGADAGRRGEFLAAVLAEAGLPFPSLTSQLMPVISRIRAVARADAAGTAELFPAVAADEIPAPQAAGQNMLVVLRVGAVAGADARRRGEFLPAVLADEGAVY